MPKRAKDLEKEDHKDDGLPETAVALSKARNAAKLRRPQVEALTGWVNAHSLYRWESGLRRVGAENFQRLMEFYRSYTERQGLRYADNVPRGTSVAEASTARFAPERVTAAPKVAGWLLRFRADLVERGATEAQAERAADLVAQVVRSPSATGKHDEWTVDEALEAMQPEADEWLDRFGRLGP